MCTGRLPFRYRRFQRFRPHTSHRKHLTTRGSGYPLRLGLYLCQFSSFCRVIVVNICPPILVAITANSMTLSTNVHIPKPRATAFRALLIFRILHSAIICLSLCITSSFRYNKLRLFFYLLFNAFSHVI